MTEALNVELGWTLEDLGLLEDFLFAEDSGLDQPMDVTMIDGFFCALLSGPRAFTLARALPWVWDSERGEQQPACLDAAQMQQITDVLMKQWQATAAELMSPQCAYEPLLGCRELGDGRQVFILDEWCAGYLLGMRLDSAAWLPLQVAHASWFETLLRYGSEEGWRSMEKQAPSDAEHEQAVAGLAPLVLQIQRYWLERRGEAPSAAPTLAGGAAPAVSREALCYCGSGRSYALCHGGH